MHCELCEQDGGRVLWRDALLRIVRPQVEGYPYFLRVVLNEHQAEMTDLAAASRDRVMRAVFACERVLRELCGAQKVNLASFGNRVPHVHWHVVARYADDPHFPEPCWGAPLRSGSAGRTAVADERLGNELSTMLAHTER